ncbi:hypothetical protein V8C35DRAFT_282885 [Trichoderma chlorosporum]
MDPSQSEEDVIRALRSFLARPSTTQRAIAQLSKYLKDDPSFSPSSPIIPTEELDFRLEMIEGLRKDYEALHPQKGPFNFTTVQFSTFLVMPMDRLDVLRRDPGSVFLYFEPDAYLFFMVNGRMRDKKPKGGGQKGSDAASHQLSTTTVDSNESIIRNALEHRKCLTRDRNACVFTKASLPEACHILPFAINDHIETTIFFSSALLGLTVAEKAKELLTTAPGSSDKSWNMISLHSTLHTWWRNCLFGVKCLGIIPHSEEYSKVRLQFHWMPHHTRKPDDLVAQPYEDVIREMLQSSVNAQGDLGLVTGMRRDSGRELETGQTFEICVEKDDAWKMKAALDIRWAVTRLAAISGAARAWELEDGLDNPGEDVDVDI